MSGRELIHFRDMPSPMPPDTRAHDHWVWVYVGQRTDTFQGYAVAHAADGPHFGLPYYIRLVRNSVDTEE
jgi:hypothetical protein